MKKPKDHIPKNAKIVFKGKTYNVWQWEQEMYDGTTKTFEKIQKNSNEVGVIAVVGDKIIIQDQQQPHRDPFISLPGGRCDEGENEQESAKRELLEETGYISEDIVLWKVFPSPYSSLVRKSYYYIAKNCKKVQNLELDNGEKIENKLISFDEFLLLSENESFRNSELIVPLLKMRLDPKQAEELKRKLFS